MNTVITIKGKMYINCGEVTIKNTTYLVLRNVDNEKYGFLKKERDTTGSFQFELPSQQELEDLKSIFYSSFDGEMYEDTNFSSISERKMKENGYVPAHIKEFKKYVEIVREYLIKNNMSTKLLDENVSDPSFEIVTKMWEEGSEAKRRKARISYNIYTNKLTIYPEGYLYILDDSSMSPEEKLLNTIFINEKIESREKLDIIHELFHISVRENLV